MTTAPTPEAALGIGDVLPAPPTARDAGPLPYPLAVGNRWQHLRGQTNAMMDSAGNWVRVGTISEDVTREIVEEQTAEGRRYFVLVEQATEQGSDQPSFTYVSGFRQDANGLYEWDGGFAPDKGDGRPQAEPAGASAPRRSAMLREIARRSPEQARKLELLERVVLRADWGAIPAPGGPAPGELYRLRYPLRPRLTWVVRDFGGSKLRATVVGLGSVQLAGGLRETAWKIRYSWPGAYGPNDVVELWYGRAGYLGMDARLTSSVTDEAGNPAGFMIVSQIHEVLVKAELVDG